MLKAYRLNDYEAWAGEDLEHAISNAMKATGESRDIVYDDCYGYELPSKLEIPDEDGRVTNVMTILAAMEARDNPGVVCFFGDC